MEEQPRKGPSPESVEFVRKMRMAAERESAEARAAEWRGRSEADHAAVFVQLADLGDAILRSRPNPWVKPPLLPGRFPWRPPR